MDRRKHFHPAKRTLIMAAMLVAFVWLANVPRAVSAPPGQIKPFATGDVLVAVQGGRVEWHNRDGSLVRILDTTVGGNTAGLAFNPSTHNLFVTNFASNTVTFFDPAGNLLGRVGGGYEIGPTSIVFDASGSAFVGLAGGLKLVKLDAGGHIVNNYKIAFDNQGLTWIDLAPDQCTMYYSTNGPSIKRFDVCKSQQLPDYAAKLPGNAYALRLLPGGGLLVADSQQILRFDANGNPLPPYAQGKNDWFGMNLDPDGTSFWSTDRNSDAVFKFDIASGKQLLSFKISSDSHVGGLAVFGEITAAQPPPPTLTPTPAPTRTLSPTPARTLTPSPTPAQTPTLSPTPTQVPTSIPLPPPLPTRQPPFPTPTSGTSGGVPGILLVGGIVVGGLVSLVALAALALAVAGRPARASADRRDRVQRADSPVQVKSHEDPGRQIVEPDPHRPVPSVRLSLGQGEVNYVIEKDSQSEPGKEQT